MLYDSTLRPRILQRLYNCRNYAPYGIDALEKLRPLLTGQETICVGEVNFVKQHLMILLLLHPGPCG